MSLKRNILVSLASQIYVALIGIAVVPAYLHFLGPEAFGLVGFFSMMQAWFVLLDAGLTPTLARETARFHGGALDAPTYRGLVRALEGIFLLLAGAGAVAVYLGAGALAQDWLRAERLPLGEIRSAIELMAVTFGLRLLSGLYRGTLSGAERLVWLGSYNSGIATLRFLGVLPVLAWVDASPSTFFGFQLAIAALELAGLALQAYRRLPALPDGARVDWSWRPLRPLLGFSLTLAFTSLVWLAVTQTDKLVLSSLLTLSHYGYFSLAVLVASGVLIVAAPIGSALMPRLARLEAAGDHAGLIDLYRRSTQVVVVVAGSIALTLAWCAQPLLLAWTGDARLAAEAGPILTLYALGNAVLAVSAFPYYLQYAKGDLRMHFVGNLVYLVVLVPAIVWAATRFGGLGAGWVWLGLNLVTFAFWLPFVHRRFEPGLNPAWYGRDVLAIAAAGSAAGALVRAVLPLGTDRVWLAAGVALVAASVLLATTAASSEARGRARGWLARA